MMMKKMTNDNVTAFKKSDTDGKDIVQTEQANVNGGGDDCRSMERTETENQTSICNCAFVVARENGDWEAESGSEFAKSHR